MKRNSGKAPSFQFYYKDWLADEKLKMCSLRAKGLWIELICQSMSMPFPGVFAFKNEIKNNKKTTIFEPISEKKLLRMFPGKPAEKRKAFAELKRYGVIKQTEDKTFYVKRIKEDMELRAKRKKAGSKGGNPALKKQKDGNLLNQNPNQTPTPSSSSSSSSSRKGNSNKGKDNHNHNHNNSFLQGAVSTEEYNLNAEDVDKLIEFWNSFAKYQVSASGILKVGQEISRILSDTQLTFEDLKGAVENYKHAKNIPRTQAPDWRMANFLRKIDEGKVTYLPEYFQPENFDKRNFEENKGKSAVERARELYEGKRNAAT